jgi:hypothetical protein
LLEATEGREMAGLVVVVFRSMLAVAVAVAVAGSGAGGHSQKQLEAACCLGSGKIPSRKAKTLEVAGPSAPHGTTRLNDVTRYWLGGNHEPTPQPRGFHLLMINGHFSFDQPAVRALLATAETVCNRNSTSVEAVLPRSSLAWSVRGRSSASLQKTVRQTGVSGPKTKAQRP